PAYEIVYLHFGTYRIADDNMGATITIDGNNKAYSLVIGIEEISSSGVAYFEISDAQWTLDPTSNNAVSEQNGKLTVSNSFYSDNPATISLTATYKGITKTFTFVLATDAAAPAPPSSFVPSSPVMTGTDGKTYQIEMQSGTNWVVTGNYISVDKNFPFSNHTDVQARVDGALHKFIWGNNAFASDGTTPVDISSIMTPVDSGHNQITQAITLVIEIYVKDENYTEMDPNKALPNMPSALKATYVLKVQ
ncbi:MAG: hypothetical protein LBV16_07350, partial [Elusimicrobiota bacterium]|nr:hypothetical protein [Elusimicrobiota bacterium]